MSPEICEKPRMKWDWQLNSLLSTVMAVYYMLYLRHKARTTPKTNKKSLHQKNWEHFAVWQCKEAPLILFFLSSVGLNNLKCVTLCIVSLFSNWSNNKILVKYDNVITWPASQKNYIVFHQKEQVITACPASCVLFIWKFYG